METAPAKNKMMTSAPVEKVGFHFPGDAVYHNAFIWAENIEEATKEYLRTRALINPPAPVTSTQETDLQK
jgi:hypothetical protein